MPIPKERFRAGFPWDEWLERLGTARGVWQRRFDDTKLGDLRAGYQEVPTPRYVACLPEGDGQGERALEVLPRIARACDQAGVRGGVELRVLPESEFPGLREEFTTREMAPGPVCVVFDRDWVQVGLWGPQARGPVERREPREGGEPGHPGERLPYFAEDGAHTLLAEFLPALDGQPTRPWRANQQMSEHLSKQAENARQMPQ